MPGYLGNKVFFLEIGNSKISCETNTCFNERKNKYNKYFNAHSLD